MGEYFLCEVQHTRGASSSLIMSEEEEDYEDGGFYEDKITELIEQHDVQGLMTLVQSEACAKYLECPADLALAIAAERGCLEAVDELLRVGAWACNCLDATHCEPALSRVMAKEGDHLSLFIKLFEAELASDPDGLLEWYHLECRSGDFYTYPATHPCVVYAVQRLFVDKGFPDEPPA